MSDFFLKGVRFFQGSTLLRRGLIVLAIGFTVLQIGFILPKNLERSDPYRDVVAYYLVMERIHHHNPVYLRQPEPGPHDRAYPSYLYPPVLASVLSTLPPMSFVTFARFWTLLLYGAFWVYAACLERLVRGKTTLAGTMVTGLFLFMFPGSHRALELGQVDPLLWAFFGLALAVPLLRGMFTMAIAVVKPWGVWPLLWSLREGRRVWAGAGLVIGVSLLACCVVLGIYGFAASCRIWLTEVVPSLAQGAWAPDNQSLSFAILRILQDIGLWNYSGGVLPAWARAWLLASGVSGPVLTGWILRHRAIDVQLAGIGCAAILFSPICWTTYCPILLTFLAALVHEECRYS